VKAWLMFALVIGSLATFPARSSAQSLRPLYDKGTATLVVDLCIGAESDEDKDALLYAPTEICVDKQGSILVTDPRMPSIKKFDRNGRCLWTIGSKGEGPGDIATPTRLAIRSDGSIVVYDIGNRRFSTFAANGKFQNTVDCSDWVWGVEVGRDDDIFVETQAPDFDGRRGGTLIRLVRFSSDFERSTVVDSTVIRTGGFVYEVDKSEDAPVTITRYRIG
jgi:hypothetical protein